MILRSVIPLMLLSFVPPQESEIDHLIIQLGSDEFNVRQEAERRLLKIGEQARPALERIGQQSEVEVRTRARRILASLDRADTQGKALGPAWTISLTEGNYSLQDVSRLLIAQLQHPLKYPEKYATSRVRLQTENIGVWAFLDRVCEVHGGLVLPLDRPDGAFLLVEGRPAKAPTSYWGPFRTWIDKITCYVGDRSGQITRSARMVLAISWQPNVHPIEIEDLGNDFDFKVNDITDARGAQLKVVVSDDLDKANFKLDNTRNNAWRSSQRLSLPASGIRKLGHVKGSIKLAFPSIVKVVEFKDPIVDCEKTVRVGPFGIELVSCQRDENGIVVHLKFSCDEVGGRNRRVPLPVRCRKNSIQIWGEDGQAVTLYQGAASHSSGAEGECFDLRGTFPTKQGAKKISIPFIVDYFVQDIPFDFSDVDLP